MTWTWDESLFAGAARYYDRGRLPYAPTLAGALAAALGLDGTGRLLDVGCGPGTVAIPMAAHVGEVVGLDPDPGMLEEAQRLAAARGVANARWVRLRAEELPAGLGAFRAVTFAASFHWMDRPLVAGTVRTMLEPGGAVVHVDNRHQDGLGPATRPPVPYDTIDELRRRWLGPDRRAGASVRNSSPSGEAEVFRAAGFEGPEIVVVPDGRELVRTIDDVVAEVFSMSFTAPHLFGDERPQFEADLRALLERASDGEGCFGVRLPDNRLVVWRPAAGD